MAFGGKKGCDICGEKLGLLGGYPVKEGTLCSGCYKKSRAIFPNDEWKAMTPAQLKAAFRNPPQAQETPAEHGGKACGVCGAKVSLLSGTPVKNGVVCESCARRLRRWYPTRSERKEYHGSIEGYDEWVKNPMSYRTIDPLREETVETLAMRLAAQRQARAEQEAEAKQTGTCTVVLRRVEFHTGMLVVKELVNTLHIPLKTAQELVLHAPSVLKENIPYEEAVQLRNALTKYDADIELR